MMIDQTLQGGNASSTVDRIYSSCETLYSDGATARERSRMHAINHAFDKLRAVVPRSNLADHQRLSKIATLRSAIQYIQAMIHILEATGGFLRPLVDRTPEPAKKGRKRQNKQSKSKKKKNHVK